MFERFTDRARNAMSLANREALRFNHSHINTEHILLGLLQAVPGVGVTALKNLGVDCVKLRFEVEKLMTAGPRATMGKLPLSSGALSVIGAAKNEAKSFGHHCVGTEHLLLGLLCSAGVSVGLRGQPFNLTTDGVRTEVLNILHGGGAYDETAPKLLARSKTASQLQIEEFMRKAGQAVPNTPTIPDEETRLLRAKLILEECFETITALGVVVKANFREVAAYSSRVIGRNDKVEGWDFEDFSFNIFGQPNIVEILDGCCDVEVVTKGTLSACGIADENPQWLVNKSNLAKFTVPVCWGCGREMVLLRRSDSLPVWHCETVICDDKRDLSANHGGYRSDGTDGNAMGKWIKPKDWVAPDLEAELNNQTAEAAGVLVTFDSEYFKVSPTKPLEDAVEIGREALVFERLVKRIKDEVLAELKSGVTQTPTETETPAPVSSIAVGVGSTGRMKASGRLVRVVAMIIPCVLRGELSKSTYHRVHAYRVAAVDTGYTFDVAAEDVQWNQTKKEGSRDDVT
jgi:Clp amino terminal domain, pathogenicity island component/Phosphoribosyl-ATP pyrophosphohydrolase